MLAAAAMTLISCETFEDGKPLKNVREAFAEMYPDARDVEWDMDVTDWKVSFELGTPPDVKDCEAWYGTENAACPRASLCLLFLSLPLLNTVHLTSLMTVCCNQSVSCVQLFEAL